MSWDLQAAKTGLVALLQGTPGLQQIFDGAPASMPTRTAAWVVVGDLVGPPRPATGGGVYELTVNLICTIGFVVGGDVQAAEDDVASAIVEIARRVLQNRLYTVSGVAPMLNGSVKTMEPPGPAAMPSDYITMAGSEVRAYPMSIQIQQRETIA